MSGVNEVVSGSVSAIMSFGAFVSLEDGSMSTRKGKVVWLEDVIAKCIEKCSAVINEKNPNLENKEEIARQVGIGAVIFYDLFSSRIKDVDFWWDRALNFEGETGPYVQYAHTRCCSVLAKAGMPRKEKVVYAKDHAEAERMAFRVSSNSAMGQGLLS